MKILITGANGFIGKNLIMHLQEKENVEIIKYDKDNTFEEIENIIDQIDFIFHLAGINRPIEVSEFYEGNSDLTAQLIHLLKQKELSVPFVITSSIQASLDNDYGKSKKIAEEIVFEYAQTNPAYIYRFHNVFGKWCRPNYNSVVATFCNNIANDLPIIVNDGGVSLDLIYIDDICYEFERLIDGKQPTEKEDKYYFINPRYNITLSELVDLLNRFKKSMNSIFIPKTGDDFVKKLYATYVSYMPVSNMITPIVNHVDDRGSFSELIRSEDSGQLSISFSKPGIVRGNHYHHTKMERFIVVKGKAKIGFTKIDDGSYFEFFVDESKIEAVTIPVGYTHNIENIGTDEMILIIWCNELFNEEKPDTFFKEVANEKA